MSLVIFFIYWAVIPLIFYWTIRLLWKRARTPLSRGMVMVMSVSVILGLLWLALGEKLWLDHQVRELCAKDGGIKVYETVTLPPDLLDKAGRIGIPDKAQAKPSDEYYYESSMLYYHKGNPEMWRLHFQVLRRLDNKLLGEATSYARRGGGASGPWHESSFGCPEKSDISDLKKKIFTNSD